jgi:hypothetical protein
MPVMFVRNRVEDYQTWRRVFDAQADAVNDAGMQIRSVWRDHEDPQVVFFLLDISDLAKAEAYVADPASAEVGRQARVLEGEIHILDDVTSI